MSQVPAYIEQVFSYIYEICRTCMTPNKDNERVNKA